MKQPLFHFLVLIFASLVSIGVYAWATERGPERYDLFDFFRGRPMPAAIPGADPEGVPAAAVEALSASLSSSHQPGALLAQVEAPVATQVKVPEPQVPALQVDPASVQLLEQFNRAIADLTDAVVPAVVSINTSTTVNVRRYVPVDPFGMFGYQSQDQEARQPGLGSGVFVSREGYVLTNHHVIAGVDEILVTTHNGEQFEAEWVGSDPGVDIAVLKLEDADGRAFPHLELADSDRARVGEMVLAVGNPFGLTESVTKGIISAKQRRLSDGANEYFQTDTVINPGNSGGPLINVRGEIVGINVALFAGQQEVHVWQGVGLAVPANEARAVFEAIAFGKPLLRGYLGIELSDINVRFARMVGLQSLDGAVIVNVQPDSPAAEAGLVAGDVILGFAGSQAADASSVMQRLSRMKAGTSVELKVFRQGKELSLSATVIEKPDENALAMRGDAAASGQSLAASIGIVVRDLSDAERATLGLTANISAILISEVEAGSAGAQRFRAGDLIHGINRDPVRKVEDFYEILGELPADQTAVMILSRRGQRFNVTLQAGP